MMLAFREQIFRSFFRQIMLKSYQSIPSAWGIILEFNLMYQKYKIFLTATETLNGAPFKKKVSMKTLTLTFFIWQLYNRNIHFPMHH